MGRWDNHTEQDKLDTITRKRTKQNQKRQAASAARPAKPKKAKLPTIVLPVEHVTGNIPATMAALSVSAPKRRREQEFRIDVLAHFGHKDGDAVTRKELNKMIAFDYWNRIYNAFPPNQLEFGSSNGFWGVGPGPALFEKPTDVSREAEADRQAKWTEEENREMEEEYRCSLIRMPDWQALFAGATEERTSYMVQRTVELVQKAVAREHKQRRKAFDVATQKPVKKVKASDDPMEHTREQISFLRWLLTTEQPAIYKDGKTVQAQKKIARQAVEEEIARLEGLVNPKAKRPDH